MTFLPVAIAGVCFSLSFVAFKQAAFSESLWFAVWIRSLGVAMLAGFFWRMSKDRPRQGSSWFQDLGVWKRTALGLASMACFYAALDQVQGTIGDVVSLRATLPLWVAALVWIQPRWAAREALDSGRGFLVLVLGVLGVLLVARPGSGVLSWVAGLAVLSGFLGALAWIQIDLTSRRGVSTDFVAFHFGLLAALAFAPLGLAEIPHSVGAWAWSFGAAALTGIGQISLHRAFRMGSASEVSKLSFVETALSYLAGLVFLSQVPTVWSLGGCVLILAAVSLSIRALLRQPKSRPT